MNLYKFAFRGSAAVALAFLTMAPACTVEEEPDDDPTAGASGEGGTAGSSGSAGRGGASGSAGRGGGAGTAGRGGGAGSSSGGTAGTAGSSAGTAGDTSDTGGQGGEPTSGSGGQGGEPTSGSGGQGGEDAGGAGGAGGVADPAAAKFCNTLSFGEEDTTMILQIGEGDDAITFTATTENCAPADGLACTVIPSGVQRIQLFDADDPTTALDSANGTVEPNSENVFFTDIEEEQPVWAGIVLDGSPTCSAFVYEDVLE